MLRYCDCCRRYIALSVVLPLLWAIVAVNSAVHEHLSTVYVAGAMSGHDAQELMPCLVPRGVRRCSVRVRSVTHRIRGPVAVEAWVVAKGRHVDSYSIQQNSYSAQHTPIASNRGTAASNLNKTVKITRAVPLRFSLQRSLFFPIDKSLMI